MNITNLLKQELWKRFGNPDYPSEWDGITYGGGKLSQRYWEYFQAIEYLNLDADSVVLDIGGGSVVMRGGFFASLLAKYVKKVIVIDPIIKDTQSNDPKIEYIAEKADYNALKNVFENYKITHVSCISVFEHIPHKIRKEIVKGINDFFLGNIFVATYEYHPIKIFWKYNLNTKDAADLFSPFLNFYPDQYSSTPVLAENAFFQHFSLGFHAVYAPRWFPVAVKFVRVN